MFHFSAFQQMLKTSLKSEGVISGFFRFSVVRLWKTSEYTPSIHSFNQVFNIFSDAFHSFHGCRIVTNPFPLPHIFSNPEGGKARRKMTEQIQRVYAESGFLSVRFALFNPLSYSC